MGYGAPHIPGGNRLDDIRIDLKGAFTAQDAWLATVPKQRVPRGRVRNAVRRGVYRVEPYRVREALVNAGLRRQWFEEFRGYWDGVLGGRPLDVMDFHNLRFSYRVAAHRGDQQALAWEGPEGHVANWQAPRLLYQTLDYTYQAALHPVGEARLLFQLLKPGMRVLEYGCAIAPTYRTWRTFLSHVPSTWVLADIPAFPFHYARHAYAGDESVSFAVIDDFEDPLRGHDGEFDLIVVRAVFEHLDRPLFIAKYLLERLRPGALFWFAFSTSHGTGLDTPSALREREATLEYLAERLDIVHGELHIDDRTLGVTVGRKR